MLAMMRQEFACPFEIRRDAETGGVSQREVPVDKRRERLGEDGLQRVLHRVVLQETPATHGSQNMCGSV